LPELDKSASSPTAPESRNLLRGAGALGVMTLGSRLLGIVRMLVVTPLLQAGYRDAFMLAFSIPNQFRILFGEGALTGSFVPLYVEKLQQQDRDGANRLASLLSTLLVLSLGGLAVLGILASLIVRSSVELGQSAEMTLRLLEIMLPFLPMVCLYAFFIAVLTSNRSFWAPGAGPMVLNVCIIAGALFAGQYYGLSGSSNAAAACVVLAVSVLVGGLLQLLLQIPFAWRRGVRLAPTVDFADEGLRKVIAGMGPVFVGSCAFQISVLLTRMLAKGYCSEGSVSYLFNSNVLVAAPIGVVAVALSTAALPILSSMYAGGDKAGFSKSLVDALRMGIFLLAPVAVVFVVGAEAISRLLFERNNWAMAETPRMARVLTWTALALVPTCVIILVNRAFYAMKKAKISAVVAVITVVFNITLCLLLVGKSSAGVFFGTKGLLDGTVRGPGLWVSGAAGLALAVCIGTWLQAITLLILIKRVSTDFPGKDLLIALLRITGLVVVVYIVSQWCLGTMPPDGEGFVHKMQRAIAPPVVGAFAFLLCASLGGFEEYTELWGLIRPGKGSKTEKADRKSGSREGKDG
jgi:putative peptidoglycan lipid II flippase